MVSAVSNGDLSHSSHGTMDPGNQLVKFADDTYIVIPAFNHHSRATELRNVETWTTKNNLALNKSKTKEVIFYDSRRRRNITTPQPLSDITRENSLKIHGVTFTCSLSATNHIRGVISYCAQTQYALRVLRSHGLNNAGLQTIYQLLYASPSTELHQNKPIDIGCDSAQPPHQTPPPVEGGGMPLPTPCPLHQNKPIDFGCDSAQPPRQTTKKYKNGPNFIVPKQQKTNAGF